MVACAVGLTFRHLLSGGAYNNLPAERGSTVLGPFASATLVSALSAGFAEVHRSRVFPASWPLFCFSALQRAAPVCSWLAVLNAPAVACSALLFIAALPCTLWFPVLCNDWESKSLCCKTLISRHTGSRCFLPIPACSEGMCTHHAFTRPRVATLARHTCMLPRLEAPSCFFLKHLGCLHAQDA